MARCSTKGCKQGATKRITITDQNGGVKSRPICNPCLEKDIHEVQEGIVVKVVDIAKKHH